MAYKSETLRKALKSNREAYEREAERLNAAAPHFAVADKLCKMIDPSFAPRVSPYMEFNSLDDKYIHFVRICVNVPRFHDTLPILECLLNNGYSPEKTDDMPAYKRRSYFCTTGDEYGIVLAAELQGEGDETCRRVITGYRVPDQTPIPIYGFECAEVPAHLISE